jgi:glyoxylase-like metal-dependent hydrolase (beta-lactamase superfamily II)
MQQDGIRPQNIGTIMNTHLHIDHCSANEAFKEVSGARIVLPRIQKDNYDFVVIQGMQAFGMTPEGFTEDSVIDESQVSVDGAVWELIVAPGHSPDSVCYYNRRDKILICGDVLFRMNTGRVDLPGGKGDQLKASIEDLSRLDIEYLLPGHMEAVSGAGEVEANFEFIRGNVFPWL